MADVIRALMRSKHDPKMPSPSWRRRRRGSTPCSVGSWAPYTGGHRDQALLQLGCPQWAA
eukprot:jgi/Mesvir1/17655/Mv25622-RA.1